MRVFIALLLVISAATAAAQSADMASKIQRAKQAQADLEKRFNEADADRDGKLTRTEAEHKMPRVFQSFAEIDSAQAGFVTLEQVRQFARGKLAARRAQSGE
jgi:endonuclease/exonuclease/phosphatase (EEP) superfamily protein YafD